MPSLPARPARTPRVSLGMERVHARNQPFHVVLLAQRTLFHLRLRVRMLALLLLRDRARPPPVKFRVHLLTDLVKCTYAIEHAFHRPEI